MITPSFQTGTVVAVDTANYNCHVLTADGVSLSDVRLMNITGGPQQVEVSWLHNYLGAPVLIVEIQGVWYIIGTLPYAGDRSQGMESGSFIPENITFKDATKTVSVPNNKQYSFKKYSPTKFLPGDKVLSADGGASIGVYIGQLVVIKAAALAQIILGGIRNFVRIIAREFSLFTDFGEVHSSHGSDGDRQFEIKGGANESESSPDGGKYTVHTIFGAVDGNDVARFSCRVEKDGKFINDLRTIDGDFVIGGDGNFDVSVDGDIRIKTTKAIGINTDKTMNVVVGSDKQSSVMGTDQRLISGDAKDAVAGTYTQTIGGDKQILIAGTLRIAAGGISLVPTAGGDCTIHCPKLNIVTE